MDQAAVTRFATKLDRLDFAAIAENHLLNETDARELGPGNSDRRGKDPPAGPGPELWPRVGYGDFTTRYLYDADIPGNPTGNPYGLLDGIVTNQTNPEGGGNPGDDRHHHRPVGPARQERRLLADRWGNTAVILRSNQDSSGGAGPARRQRRDRGSVPERTVVFA